MAAVRLDGCFRAPSLVGVYETCGCTDRLIWFELSVSLFGIGTAVPVSDGVAAPLSECVVDCARSGCVVEVAWEVDLSLSAAYWCSVDGALVSSEIRTESCAIGVGCEECSGVLSFEGPVLICSDGDALVWSDGLG